MRIAVIVFGLPPTRIGGTEIGTQEISRYLAKNHKVHVYTLGLPSEEPEEERYGFHIHRLKSRWIYQLPGVDALYYLSLLRSLKTLRPDIIQIMGLKNRGSYGSLIARFLDIPYVIWDRGSMNELSHIYRKTIGYFVLRNAHAVIAQTPDMKQMMKTIVDRSIHVLPNGVDLEAYRISADSNDDDNDDIDLSDANIRNDHRLENKKIVIFLGRMDPVKCVPDIIDSIAIARNSFPDIHLLMIGRGPEWDEMAAYVRHKGIEEYCTMVGSVPHEKVPDYLMASDVQVLVSSGEGYPISVIEGMAAGLPQIVSNVAGLPDIVKDGINGFVVPVHSPEKIAEKLGILFNDLDLRMSMSRENRSLARSHSWDSIVGKLESIYQYILDPPFNK